MSILHTATDLVNPYQTTAQLLIALFNLVSGKEDTYVQTDRQTQTHV